MKTWCVKRLWGKPEEEMGHQTGTFMGASDTELFYQRWNPSSRSRGVLVLVHGFGEHSGRYSYLVQWMLERDYTIYAFDLRGHGNSPGRRGHINGWHEFREDLRRFLRLVEAMESPSPLYLVGHSLGGLIVLECALRGLLGLRGIIACAPAIGRPPVKPGLMQLAWVMSMIWPTFSVKVDIDPSKLSRDPEVVRAYKEDPLVHNRASARFGAQMELARSWTMAHAREFPFPLLMLHGGADKLASAEASRVFYGRVISRDKELRIYRGGYHELHNDIHREQVLEDMCEWLEEHTGV